MDNIHDVFEDLKLLKERFHLIETSFGNIARKNNLLTERLSFVETDLSERLFVVETVLKQQRADRKSGDGINHEKELIIENGHIDVLVETNIDNKKASLESTKNTQPKELSPGDQHEKKRNNLQKCQSGGGL